MDSTVNLYFLRYQIMEIVRYVWDTLNLTLMHFKWCILYSTIGIAGYKAITQFFNADVHICFAVITNSRPIHFIKALLLLKCTFFIFKPAAREESC